MNRMARTVAIIAGATVASLGSYQVVSAQEVADTRQPRHEVNRGDTLWDLARRYLVDLVAPAEIPSNVNAFKSQQFRWAKGSIQTAKKLLPRILTADISGRSFFSRDMRKTFACVPVVRGCPLTVSQGVSQSITIAPVFGSAMRISTCGCTRPTVSVRWARESSGSVCVDTGDVSVIP